MVQLIGGIFAFIAGLGVAYNVAAAWLVLRAVVEVVDSPDYTDEPCLGVTILKPLCGDEPLLATKLASFFSQEYAGPIQLVFGVRDADDPALVAIYAAQRSFPRVDCAVAVKVARHGSNNKLSNLINMAQQIKHPLVIIADSDVEASPNAVAVMADALADPQTGIASMLHVGRGDAGFWSRLAAMDISYRFMPSVILGTKLKLAYPVLGPMMGLRRNTLDQLGGFEAFSDVLADDYELGRAVRALGLNVAVCNTYVVHGCSERSRAEVIRHELRWTRTIYNIDPTGFTGSVITHVFPNALIAACLMCWSLGAFGLIAAALTTRVAVKMAMDRASNSTSGSIFLLPLRDILSYAVYLMTFFVRTVDWRGARFAVNSDGTISPKRPT